MCYSQRFRLLLNYLKENKVVRNQQDFTERVSSDKSTISQIMNGRLTPPNDLFGRVALAFPSVNEEWLRSGEGEMLKPSVQQTSYGKNSPNVNGNGNLIGGGDSLDKAFAEIAAQRSLVERTLALLEKRDAQLDRIIDLLEKSINSKS